MPHQGPESSFGAASPIRVNSNLGTDHPGDPERHDQVLELTDCAQDPPDATGDNASVCVENKGGNLSGPNGNVVDGGLDGKDWAGALQGSMCK